MQETPENVKCLAELAKQMKRLLICVEQDEEVTMVSLALPKDLAG